MISIVIYVSKERYDDLVENGLPSSIGAFAHNIAVMCFPYDTGNARGAISLAVNKPRVKKIQYNLMKANYIYFLEEGIGPVKKHKGVISTVTRGAITEQLVSYLLTGVEPTFISPPVVALRRSQYRPFGAKSSVTGTSEKDVLRQANMATYGISPQARGQVSKIRETVYRTMVGGKITSSRGIGTETTKLQGQRPMNKINRNLSILGNIYKIKKQEYLANREEAKNLSTMNITSK